MYVKVDITITLIAETSSPEILRGHLMSKDLSEIVYEITDGDMAGTHVVGEGVEIPPERLEDEVAALGVDPSFFGEDVPK